MPHMHATSPSAPVLRSPSKTVRCSPTSGLGTVGVGALQGYQQNGPLRWRRSSSMRWPVRKGSPMSISSWAGAESLDVRAPHPRDQTSYDSCADVTLPSLIGCWQHSGGVVTGRRRCRLHTRGGFRCPRESSRPIRPARTGSSGLSKADGGATVALLTSTAEAADRLRDTAGLPVGVRVRPGEVPAGRWDFVAVTAERTHPRVAGDRGLGETAGRRRPGRRRPDRRRHLVARRHRDAGRRRPSRLRDRSGPAPPGPVQVRAADE